MNEIDYADDAHWQPIFHSIIERLAYQLKHQIGIFAPQQKAQAKEGE